MRFRLTRLCSCPDLPGAVHVDRLQPIGKNGRANPKLISGYAVARLRSAITIYSSITSHTLVNGGARVGRASLAVILKSQPRDSCPDGRI